MFYLFLYCTSPKNSITKEMNKVVAIVKFMVSEELIEGLSGRRDTDIIRNIGIRHL